MATVIRRPKYRNTKVCHDGERFDSIAEFNRYRQLQILERAGQIANLTRQVDFVLAPRVIIQGKTKAAMKYKADFSYTNVLTGCYVVEDVKGMLTPIYKVKRHLMKWVHEIDIVETK